MHDCSCSRCQVRRALALGVKATIEEAIKAFPTLADDAAAVVWALADIQAVVLEGVESPTTRMQIEGEMLDTIFGEGRHNDSKQSLAAVC